MIKNKYKNKFEDNEIIEAINIMLTSKINLENVKPAKDNKPRKPRVIKTECVLENASPVSNEQPPLG